MVTFAIIAAVGLLLLVATSFLDEIFNFGDGLFSGVTIGAGAMIFGASGVIALGSGLPSFVAYGISLALFFITLVITRKITSLAQASETKERPSMVGVEGTVTVTVSSNGGEVRLNSIHEMEPRMARSNEVIPTGTKIKVVSDHGGLTVEPLTPTTQNEA